MPTIQISEAPSYLEVNGKKKQILPIMVADRCGEKIVKWTVDSWAKASDRWARASYSWVGNSGSWDGISDYWAGACGSLAAASVS